jgi:type-F conjugative transfer system pilin assembly protein TrbC
MLSVVITIFAGISFASVAEDYEREEEKFARELLEQQTENNVDFKERKNPNLEKAFKEAEKLAMEMRNIPTGAGCRECGGGLRLPSAKEGDSGNGILVFVSFSMPEAALRILSHQAEKYGAKLMLRGVVDGSFQKTGEAMRKILMDCDLFVHPELFKKYAVKRTPTFIKVKDGKEIGRLCGNVDLEFVAEKFKGS